MHNKFQLKYKDWLFENQDELGAVSEESSFEHGSTAGSFIGYRAMRYDPNTNTAISGADSRHFIELKKGDVIDYGGLHFITNSSEYAKDYYAVHANNVIVKVEFNDSDVLEGNMTDVEPEVQVRRSKILGWKIYNDLDEGVSFKFNSKVSSVLLDF